MYNIDLELIFMCAVRYSLGRRTYVPAAVIEYLTPRIPKLSLQCKESLIRDIEKQKYVGKDPYGHSFGKERWMEFLKLLKKSV